MKHAIIFMFSFSHFLRPSSFAVVYLLGVTLLHASSWATPWKCAIKFHPIRCTMGPGTSERSAKHESSRGRANNKRISSRATTHPRQAIATIANKKTWRDPFFFPPVSVSGAAGFSAEAGTTGQKFPLIWFTYRRTSTELKHCGRMHKFVQHRNCLYGVSYCNNSYTSRLKLASFIMAGCIEFVEEAELPGQFAIISCWKV